MTVARRSSMPRATKQRRQVRTRTVLAGLVLGLFGLLTVPASPAAAHAVLSGSSPAQGSVVSQPPTQVVLTFTEGVTAVTDRVHVIAPDGSKADTGEPRATGNQLVIPLKPEVGEGTFLVNYRVLSADSHPVGGAFTYSVGAPSPGGPPTGDAGDQAANPTIRAAFPVARWIGYVGLLLLVGSVLVLALLWPKRLERRDPIRVIWLGAGMVALATVLELILQVPYVAGGGLGDFRAADIREVLASQFGAAHLIRLGVLAAAMLLVRPIVRGRGWGADRVLLAVLGTIGVATWSVSGHPSATSVPMVTVVADMIHIAAMSVWLGGLVMLIGFLLPRGTRQELAAIIPIWSRWAAYAVATLVITGVAQALVELGDLSAVLTTSYGWLLLAKIGLAGVAIAVASQSRRLVAVISSGVDGAGRSPTDSSETTETGTAETGTAETGTAEHEGSDHPAVVGAGATSAAATVESGAGSGAGRPVAARSVAAGSVAVKANVNAAAGAGSGSGPNGANGSAASQVGFGDETGAEEPDGTVDQPEDGNGEGDDPSAPDAALRQRRALHKLRGLIVAEALVAAVVLGVTSVLVQTTPARSATVAPGVASSVQSATLRDKLFILAMDVQPATVGLNDVHLYATTPDGQPADIKEWTVRASAPEQGIEAIDATILPVTPDHAIGQIGIPAAGTWTFTFTLRTTEIDQSTVTTQVVVK